MILSDIIAIIWQNRSSYRSRQHRAPFFSSHRTTPLISPNKLESKSATRNFVSDRSIEIDRNFLQFSCDSLFQCNALLLVLIPGRRFVIEPKLNRIPTFEINQGRMIRTRASRDDSFENPSGFMKLPRVRLLGSQELGVEQVRSSLRTLCRALSCLSVRESTFARIRGYEVYDFVPRRPEFRSLC